MGGFSEEKVKGLEGGVSGGDTGVGGGGGTMGLGDAGPVNFGGIGEGVTGGGGGWVGVVGLLPPGISGAGQVGPGDVCRGACGDELGLGMDGVVGEGLEGEGEGGRTRAALDGLKGDCGPGDSGGELGGVDGLDLER